VLAVTIMILLGASLSAQAEGLLGGFPAGAKDTTPCRRIVADIVKVPNDFSLFYRSGPRRARKGSATIVTVEASGKATARIGGGGAAAQERRLSRRAIQQVYASVVACGFFALKESYDNPRIRDGGVSRLSVTSEGKTHDVVIANRRVARFDTIVSALYEALALKP
jgi:hypothetical protein